MLAIVMPREPLMPRFCDFLKEQTEYKVINFDQWTSFLRFAQEVSVYMHAEANSFVLSFVSFCS